MESIIIILHYGGTINSFANCTYVWSYGSTLYCLYNYSNINSGSNILQLYIYIQGVQKYLAVSDLYTGCPEISCSCGSIYRVSRNILQLWIYIQGVQKYLAVVDLHIGCPEISCSCGFTYRVSRNKSVPLANVFLSHSILL